MRILELTAISKQYMKKEKPALKNISMDINQGEILALVGESGSGKTTLLRIIAGLETPDDGSLAINGLVLSGRDTFVVPKKRGVGLVFQDYALFPHLSIEENIVYGINYLKLKDKKRKLEELLVLTELEDHRAKFPHELSGGQQQRVALARALAPEPKVLLLDEPFSNLDAVLKRKIRNEVSAILQKSNTTTIFVTHDVKDAFSMADRIAILKEGELIQLDTPKNIYECPKTPYIANLSGTANILEGSVEEGKLKSPFGNIELSPSFKNGSMLFSIRPEHVLITKTEEGLVNGIIKKTAYLGNSKEVTIQIDGKFLIVSRTESDSVFKEGENVELYLEKKDIYLFDN